MSLFAELKRRNVFKVGAAYLALGWIVVQATATLTPAFHLPESALPLVTWIGVIGFPFVVVFAWVFELTPEGLKRETEVDRSQSITHVTSKRLDYIIIAMLAVAIGLFLFDRFVPRDAPAPETAVGAGHARDTSASEDAGADSRADGPLPQREAAAPAPDAKSIAVLPFVNMSEDAGNAFFADGISEELLNLLVKIPELQVIARTSSFAYKGQNAKIADVARELHVAHILEGSVRKSGNRVRITAQLVRASDSVHLWSETYDRELTDIFAVQDEIAGAVVTQLKVTLLGAAPTARAANPAAYALFLRARQLGRQGTGEGWDQSLSLYQQALAIDPGYAAAWDGLAYVYSRQADKGFRTIEAGYTLARQAAEKALALDPDYAPAHDNLGYIAMSYDGDLAAAAVHYARALALEPGNTDILSNAGRLLASLGRLDAAVAIGEFVIARDPVNSFGYSDLGYAYRSAGRLSQSSAAYRSALGLAPGVLSLRYQLGMTLLLQNQPEAALAEIEREVGSGWRRFGLAMAYYTLARKTEADAALAELIADGEQSSSYNIAYILAWRNEPDRAFEWLDKALAYKDPGLSDIVNQPEFANIRKDPRWLPLLQKIGRAPEQLAAIPFEVKLPH